MIGTEDVTNRIKNNEQIVFVKYGDGETLCMLGYEGGNCDNDPYTPSLGEGLRNSLKFYIENKDFFVGRWHDNKLINPIIENLKMGEPTWAPYHLVMNADNIYDFPYMYDFLKSIQDTKRKKIIVSNNNNIYMKSLFHADTFIEVPPNNWFINFEQHFEAVKHEIVDDCILFTSAGQGSKVLIAELLKLFPKLSCIDIGSSFDFLCQRRITRDRGAYDYNRELIYYNDLLPKSS